MRGRWFLYMRFKMALESLQDHHIEKAKNTRSKEKEADRLTRGFVVENIADVVLGILL